EPSRLRLLKFWLMPITRSPAQKSACKNLERDGQARAITPEAALTLRLLNAPVRAHFDF
ncbi:hypothetical protein AAULR_21172, partial [Lacticaseibacillus rhamnosus MTCC 5462]